MVTEPKYSCELARTRECARLAREFLEVHVPASPAAGPPDLGGRKFRDDLAENGRGLQVVDAVSSEWGWDISGPTLTVWVTVSQ